MNAVTQKESQDLTTIEPEQHDRQKLLGGSDIAAVLNISPWKTPLDLYNDKIKPRTGDGYKAVFARGIRWESVVAEMLVERLENQGHKVKVLAANKRYRDQEHTFMASEIDYEVVLDDDDEITNVELKTVHPFRMRDWGDSGSDDLPVHYTAQVMHGLGVTRRNKGMLAALFGADELRTYPVMADQETIAAIRARAVAFWTDHVLAGVPPAPVNLEDLSNLFSHEAADTPALLADEGLTDIALRMRAARAQIKAGEAEALALEFQIKLAMKDAGQLILPNGKVAFEWKNKSGKYLDETGLKEAHPKIAKEFMKTWEKRVFTVKPFAIDDL
jgi:putative phage-type endonuclease